MLKKPNPLEYSRLCLDYDVSQRSSDIIIMQSWPVSSPSRWGIKTFMNGTEVSGSFLRKR